MDNRMFLTLLGKTQQSLDEKEKEQEDSTRIKCPYCGKLMSSSDDESNWKCLNCGYQCYDQECDNE